MVNTFTLIYEKNVKYTQRNQGYFYFKPIVSKRSEKYRRKLVKIKICIEMDLNSESLTKSFVETHLRFLRFGLRTKVLIAKLQSPNCGNKCVWYK